MTETRAAITADNVVKRYGGGRYKAAPVTAVDDVSLTVGAGEFFGILGLNGAGKTTLLATRFLRWDAA